MSQAADQEARPISESVYKSKDHDFVIGANWIKVPGFGDMRIWVSKNGNPSNITIYNSIITRKKTHTPAKNVHWVSLDVKQDGVE